MIQIALGVGENKNIIEASDLFKAGHKNTSIEYIDNDNDLAEAITNKNYDAVIRGSLHASGVMGELKKKYPKISRATYIHDDEKEFLLTPVGIDEGMSIWDKVEIAKNCSEFLKKLNKTPKIAVLASGRKGDYGRSEEISRSIDESEKLTQILKKRNYNVKNHYILIEKAIKDKSNIIIAPNGIMGNIIFRTLVLVNNWPSYGAVTFGINGIYIDTSRDQNVEGYRRSLELAYKLANI